MSAIPVPVSVVNSNDQFRRASSGEESMLAALMDRFDPDFRIVTP